MATESFRLSTVIPASAERLYNAWLDSREHSAFTGGPATIEPGVGGQFTAWDGYITGTTLELAPGRRIVQSWRTTQFSAEDPDSRLEITFEPAENGTRVVLDHTNAPIGQGYEEGWQTHYFTPMQAYFGKAVEPSSASSSEPARERPVNAVPKKKPAKNPTKKAARKAPGAKKGAKRSAAKKPVAREGAKAGAKKGAGKGAKKAKPSASKKSAKRKSR